MAVVGIESDIPFYIKLVNIYYRVGPSVQWEL